MNHPPSASSDRQKCRGEIAAAATLEGEAFERHASVSVHFFSRNVPPLLRDLLADLSPGAKVVDVGCGDGQLVCSLLATNCLPMGAAITGVDLSPLRVERFKRLTGQPAMVANGTDLEGVPDAFADIGISTMVMEHVHDDFAYARSLSRVLRSGGRLYLTTVLRRRGAWYFRKSPDGRRVLDPTHVREYESVERAVAPLLAAGFTVKLCALERLVFPIAHPFVRQLNRIRPIKDVQRIFLLPPWSWIERIGLPIPRYREIQIVAHKN